jgi:prophage regulatory protein
MPNTIRILRRKDVQQRTGLSRSSLYLRMSEGTFPRSISLGSRAVGWIESEIDAWLQECIAMREHATQVSH